MNGKEEAYFTVEASLILPLVMLFTVMMIFLAFYSYDRCILEHSAYEAAVRGTWNHMTTAQEAQEAARLAAGRLIEGKLIAIYDLDCCVKADADKVTVSYHGVVKMPMLSWLAMYVSGIHLTIDISRSAQRLHPARTVRDCQLLNRLAVQDIQ